MLSAAIYRALSYATRERKCRAFKIVCEQNDAKWQVGIEDDGEGFIFDSIEEKGSWLDWFVSIGICQKAELADAGEKVRSSPHDEDHSLADLTIRNSFETNFQRITEYQKSELSHRIVQQVAGMEIHLWVGLHTCCESQDPENEPDFKSRIKIFAFHNCIPMNISPFDTIEKFLIYFEKYASTPYRKSCGGTKMNRLQKKPQLEECTEISCYISLIENEDVSGAALSSLSSTISSMFRRALIEIGSGSSKRVREEIVNPIFFMLMESDTAIELLARMCNVPRFQLNIVSYSKGLVYGALIMKDLEGNIIHCKSGPTTLPSFSHEMRVLSSELLIDQAHALFVVEKECIFRRLCDDVQTRILLSRLSKMHPNLPIYGISDWDPDGIEIILTYVFGSRSREHEKEFLRCSTMRWLGLHSNDIKTFGVPKALRLELSSRDRARISRMCERKVTGDDNQSSSNLLPCKVIKEHPQWKNELEEMLIQDSKYEIECLNAVSQGGVNALTNLSNHYIHDKICRFDYLTLNGNNPLRNSTISISVE
eukprot:184576-Hanusia_phi.AAC.4